MNDEVRAMILGLFLGAALSSKGGRCRKVPRRYYAGRYKGRKVKGPKEKAK